MQLWRTKMNPKRWSRSPKRNPSRRSESCGLSRNPWRRRSAVERLENRHLLAADGLHLAPDSFEVDQNSQPILLNVLNNDAFDVDYQGSRQITANSTGSLGGQIEVRPDALYYRPPANTSGIDSFQYTVDNLQSAQVDVRINPVLPLRTWAIDQLQDTYRFQLIDSSLDDSFPEDYAGQRRITRVSETTHNADLSISDDGRSIIYRYDQIHGGEDTFTYVVDDLYVGTVKVSISNPVASDSFEFVQHSGSHSLDVLANDFVGRRTDDTRVGVINPSDWSEIRESAQITHLLDDHLNEFTIAEDGRSITFSASADQLRSRSVRYVVNGQYESYVWVTNHRPVVDDSFEADRFETDRSGGNHYFDVLTNDVYRSIKSRTEVDVVDIVTEVTQSENGGTVSIAPGGAAVVYSPPQDFAGQDSFSYVADGTHRATVRVSVNNPVRDDVANVIAGSITPIDVLANDFLGNESDQVDVASVTDSLVGATITVGSNGVIYYASSESSDDFSTDSFEYVLRDGRSATVAVRITSPTQGDYYTVSNPENAFHVLNNDDFGSHYQGERVITGVSEISDGSQILIGEDGRKLMVTAATSSFSFQYTVDGRFSATVVVRQDHRLRPDHAVADENGDAISIPVLKNDYTELVGPRIVSAPATSREGGSIEVIDNIAFYTPPRDFHGVDVFQYYINGFLTSTAHINVVSRASDDVVRVSPDSTDNILNLRANDIHGADYTGPGLITNVSDTTQGGRVRIADGGLFVAYTPPSRFSGEDSFTYSIDGRSEATVTVQVRSETTSSLRPFDSADELKEYLIERGRTQHQAFFGTPAFRISRFPLAYSTDSAGASEIQHSETNVQVAGVDEHDIVETDGRFLYTLRGNELVIVRTLPADELELQSQSLVEGTPVGMFLDGNRLTILSERIEYQPYPITSHGYPSSILIDGSFAPRLPSNAYTVATTLDVSDRSSPTIVSKTEFEGRFVDARRVDEEVILVLGADALVPEIGKVCDDDSLCIFESEEQYVERLKEDFAAVIEETLPSYASYDSAGNLVRGGPLLLPENLYRSSSNATTVNVLLSFNMQSGEPGISSVKGVESQWGTKIYATASSVYLFNDMVQAVDNEPWTEVLKFDLDTPSGEIEYAATGQIPGRMLNQFSADERDGLLRVTTEISNTNAGNYSSENETGVFVLEDNFGTLEFVGSLHNLSLGRSVKSVRYYGDRLFVTTFSSVDPLHAIDLSDPTSPKAMGHVPITGFNRYMQFISPDRLLTIGTNTANGFGGRSMVSLYDVSNLDRPHLVDQYNLPRFSSSLAGSDHHAFGWFSRQDLLSVPTASHYRERHDADDDGYRESYRTVREDELAILHVGINGDGVESITSRGTVQHHAKVQRSVSINDHLYSVGDDGVRVVNAENVAAGNTQEPVDELLFDWVTNIHSNDWHPIEHHDVAAAARALVATKQQIAPADLMLVTRETAASGLEIVLRAGEKSFLVTGESADSLTLADENFQFSNRHRHNTAMPMDANNDGKVTAQDALHVINELSGVADGQQGHSGVMRQIHVIDESFSDTNGDGHVTPIDILQIINDLAAEQEQQHAEAESGALLERRKDADDSLTDDAPATLLF